MGRYLQSTAIVLILIPSAAAVAQQNTDGQIPITSLPQPYVLLIRDPHVHAYLKLSADQRKTIRQISDEFDVRLLAMRNQPEAAVVKTLAEITESAQLQMKSLLTFHQRKRLEFVQIQMRGMRCLLDEAMREKLELSKGQYDEIHEVVLDTDERAKALKDAAKGGVTDEIRQQVVKLAYDQERKVAEILSREQRVKFRAAVGDPIEIYKLGHVKFKSPELFGDEWLNSEPLTMNELQEKVVVLHFWTYRSRDCRYNYPIYRDWHDSFAQRGVVVLGIHTPETDGESIVSRVKSTAQAEQLSFPILVDNKRRNWKAWGNSIWPSTYLIDKQGYIRYWWYGALDNQDVEASKVLKKRIEELLVEM